MGRLVTATVLGGTLWMLAVQITGEPSHDVKIGATMHAQVVAGPTAL
jgi:hypothetical protein